jgi:hypothetical protein
VPFVAPCRSAQGRNVGLHAFTTPRDRHRPRHVETSFAAQGVRFDGCADSASARICVIRTMWNTSVIDSLHK